MPFLTRQAVARPGVTLWISGLVAAAMIALVAAPTLAPETFPLLRPLQIDTDPENMLAPDEPVRVFHNAMKAEFGLHDWIVVGVVQPDHPDGVFNPRTLADIHALAARAETIRWTDGDRVSGVVSGDSIALSTVDNIDQAGLGAVSFSWLMPVPPTTADEARAVRAKTARLPMLQDTLVSRDGKAAALYLPITSKDASYRVASELREAIAGFDDAATYYITGLPIAQDQFGVEMFVQMAIAAPAAMVLIFLLLWLFFRRVRLVVSPMIVALLSVIGAMGALIATGQTVHIMSSMIPIFVMPIAVLDAVHMLSEFHDRYPAIRDRERVLAEVMHELWRPMLFTTLTTCAGFASLALTPIPPVQVFGIFVAVGVLLAWVFTVTLIPAYIMRLPGRSLEGFGLRSGEPAPATESSQRSSHTAGTETSLGRALAAVGRLAVGRARLVLAVLTASVAVAAYGMSQISINDNPVNWFTPKHDIRVADAALNERFAGTYMAYLVLTPDETSANEAGGAAVTARALEALERLGTGVAQAVAGRLRAAPGSGSGPDAVLAWAQDQQDLASDEQWPDWSDAVLALEGATQPVEVFKRPDVLRFMEQLQAALLSTGQVGKSTAVTDIVKTVHRELFAGTDEEFRIPDTAAAVAQTLLTYESSHRPQDLYKLVTPDYDRANVWVQLTSGDNQDMNAVVDAVDAFMATHPAPVPLRHEWFGLTYVNTVWQREMVRGMARAFLGSFAIVLALMIVLFRSAAWGVLSMVPLSVTIALIYGAIGLIGKDYDMPIAVLSSLSLGLAIDYAIHFIERTRASYARLGRWPDTVRAVFGEPARAIFRNVIVIGTGFLPLLLAPLVPYQTVGVFISAILLLAGVTTLFALPAIVTVLPRVFLRQTPSS